jgi:hypothetical protein
VDLVVAGAIGLMEMIGTIYVENLLEIMAIYGNTGH